VPLTPVTQRAVVARASALVAMLTVVRLEMLAEVASSMKAGTWTMLQIPVSIIAYVA
jgi:hypothetical protein